jgi:hypothetical protein
VRPAEALVLPSQYHATAFDFRVINAVVLLAVVYQSAQTSPPDSLPSCHRPYWHFEQCAAAIGTNGSINKYRCSLQPLHHAQCKGTPHHLLLTVPPTCC